MTLMDELDGVNSRGRTPPPSYDGPTSGNRRNFRRRAISSRRNRGTRRFQNRTLSTSFFLIIAAYMQQFSFDDFFAILILEKDERCCLTRYKLSIGRFVCCALLVSFIAPLFTRL